MTSLFNTDAPNYNKSLTSQINLNRVPWLLSEKIIVTSHVKIMAV